MYFYNNRKRKRTILIASFLLVVASVFYYSWLSYSNLRTAVPFIALGYLFEVWTNLSQNSNLKKKLPFQIKNFLISTLIVGLVEVGQFLIVDRHPDLMDVFFGLLGSLTGSCMYHLIQKINLLLTKNA